MAVGAAGGPDRARQRPPDAVSAATSRRTRTGRARGGAAPGGKGMKRMLLTAAMLALLAPPAAQASSRRRGTSSRWEQPGGHRRPGGPAPLQGPQAAEHRPRPRRADGRIRPTPSPCNSSPSGSWSARADQLVDDAFTSPDGRLLYVSRRSSPTSWRSGCAPGRSPGAPRSRATAPTTWRSQRPATGCRVGLDRPQGPRHRHPHGPHHGQLQSGDQPHGQLLGRRQARLPRSIGTVFTPTDDPLLDRTKGDRWFEIVDAKTLQVQRRLDMGAKLAEAGYPN